MTQLQYIDADSHIEEGPRVWDYLDPLFRNRKPQIIEVNYPEPLEFRNKAWLIDGRIFPHPYGRNPLNFSTPSTMKWAAMKPVSVQSQSLDPPSARIADMDAAGIAVQVNYPTIFLGHLTTDRVFEAALMRAWNRWMCEICSEYKDRLKWVALIPLWNPQEALKELNFAKENGAIGMYTLGTVYDVFLSDQTFDPVYAACEELDMPVCVHIGWAHTGLNSSCDSMLASILFTFEQSMLHALYSFIAGGVLDRFKRLRVGFLEGEINHYVTLIQRIEYWRQMNTAHPQLTSVPPRRYVEEGRIFFSCEGDEHNLPEFIAEMGENQVMLSADFPHVHFQENGLCNGVSELKHRQDIDERLKYKISVENSASFYDFQIPEEVLPETRELELSLTT